MRFVDVRSVCLACGTAKAAIGTYFLEHIMQSMIEPRLNGVWSYSQLHCPRAVLHYRTGPGVIPSKVPQQTKHGEFCGRGFDCLFSFAYFWLLLLPVMMQRLFALFLFCFLRLSSTLPLAHAPLRLFVTCRVYHHSCAYSEWAQRRKNSQCHRMA